MCSHVKVSESVRNCALHAATRGSHESVATMLVEIMTTTLQQDEIASATEILAHAGVVKPINALQALQSDRNKSYSGQNVETVIMASQVFRLRWLVDRHCENIYSNST